MDDRTDELEAPPPYTPAPSADAGEATLEHGPARPFQAVPPLPSSQSIHQPVNNINRNDNSRTQFLFQQLSNSLNNIVSYLDRPSTTARNTWVSYPEAFLSHPPANSVEVRPPPLPKRPPSSTQAQSDFVRDFYAAGATDNLVTPEFAPPDGPPPQRPDSTSSTIPDDGRPTTHPVVGHPLLNEDNVLVYPKGYNCDKCDNIGYKDADPLRPCTRCWSKYAKPFSGPLAYSFSSSSSGGNFQRPLPPPRFHPSRTPEPSTSSLRSSPVPLLSPPPPGAVVYKAGDPRIGGVLCWRCGGKGNVSLLFVDRTNCPACGGVGRILS